MRPEITESSYAWALVNDLVNNSGYRLTAAPEFPNLRDEGTKKGYDVKLEVGAIPLFLQFKLSEFMIGQTAREYRDGLVSLPFYRMHIRPSWLSSQHDMLLSLESRGYSVFYTAPYFHKVVELNHFYLTGRVRLESFMVAPSLIGPLPDHKPHRVSFERNGRWYFLSEPKPIESGLDWEQLSEFLASQIRDSSGTQTELSARLSELLEDMQKIIVEFTQFDAFASSNLYRESERGIVSQITYFAKTFFDCDFFMISDGQGSGT